MHVSKKVDYAVRAMAYLADHPDQRSRIAEIAEAMAVPQAFMAKVLRSLVSGDLVSSQVGPGGGYRLGRDPSTITFRELVEAVDGEIHIVPCQHPDEDSCILIDHCVQISVWDRIRLRMLEVLSEYTLDEVRSSGLSLRPGLPQPPVDRS